MATRSSWQGSPRRAAPTASKVPMVTLTVSSVSASSSDVHARPPADNGRSTAIPSADREIDACLVRSCQPVSAVSRLPKPTDGIRSEEHTSELQSLMRISYAVFCLKKKKKHQKTHNKK